MGQDQRTDGDRRQLSDKPKQEKDRGRACGVVAAVNGDAGAATEVQSSPAMDREDGHRWEVR